MSKNTLKEIKNLGMYCARLDEYLPAYTTIAEIYEHGINETTWRMLAIDRAIEDSDARGDNTSTEINMLTAYVEKYQSYRIANIFMRYNNLDLDTELGEVIDGEEEMAVERGLTLGFKILNKEARNLSLEDLIIYMAVMEYAKTILGLLDGTSCAYDKNKLELPELLNRISNELPDLDRLLVVGNNNTSAINVYESYQQYMLSENKLIIGCQLPEIT